MCSSDLDVKADESRRASYQYCVIRHLVLRKARPSIAPARASLTAGLSAPQYPIARHVQELPQDRLQDPLQNHTKAGKICGVAVGWRPFETSQT